MEKDGFQNLDVDASFSPSPVLFGKDTQITTGKAHIIQTGQFTLHKKTLLQVIRPGIQSVVEMSGNAGMAAGNYLLQKGKETANMTWKAVKWLVKKSKKETLKQIKNIKSLFVFHEAQECDFKEEALVITTSMPLKQLKNGRWEVIAPLDANMQNFIDHYKLKVRQQFQFALDEDEEVEGFNCAIAQGQEAIEFLTQNQVQVQLYKVDEVHVGFKVKQEHIRSSYFQNSIRGYRVPLSEKDLELA